MTAKKATDKYLPDDSSLSKDRLRVWLKLIKAQTLIENEIRSRLRSEFDTTLPRFDVMSALQRFPDGLKMSEISDLLKVSNGNVTGIVERLTKDGLALRVAVPNDRRVQRVQLTKKGRASFKKMAISHEQWLNEMLEQFGSRQLQSMNTLLDKVTNQLNAGY